MLATATVWHLLDWYTWLGMGKVARTARLIGQDQRRGLVWPAGNVAHGEGPGGELRRLRLERLSRNLERRAGDRGYVCCIVCLRALGRRMGGG